MRDGRAEEDHHRRRRPRDPRDAQDGPRTGGLRGLPGGERPAADLHAARGSAGPDPVGRDDELDRRVRALPRGEEERQVCGLPGIFLSAKKTANDIRTGLAAGASDYFSKPIDMERLLARIAQLIGPAAPATPEQRR